MNNYHEEVEQRTVTAMKIIKVIGLVIIGCLMAVLLGFVVMWLWNKLVPDIFGLKEITYWQGVGLFILTRMLFGGIGSGKSSSNADSPKGVITAEIQKEVQKEMESKVSKEYMETEGVTSEHLSTNVKNPELVVSDALNPEQTENEGLDTEQLGQEKKIEVSSADLNKDQEELYEQWWEKEGEQMFESFLKKP